jgi:hypothetical protein
LVNMEFQARKELNILENGFVASHSHKQDRDHDGPPGRATRLQLGKEIGLEPSKLLVKRTGKVNKEMDLIDGAESQQLPPDN